MLSLSSSVRFLNPTLNVVTTRSIAHIPENIHIPHIEVKKNSGLSVVEKRNESIAKISKPVLNSLAAVELSRFNYKMDLEIGSYITRLPPKIIYEHAINMFNCEDADIKQEGLYLLFKAARKGNLEAMNKLGSLIANKAPEINLDQEFDPKIGFKFLIESLKRGSSQAAVEIGHLYLKGHVVKQNLKRAEEYYMIAHDMVNQTAFDHVRFVRQIIAAPNSNELASILSLKSRE